MRGKGSKWGRLQHATTYRLPPFHVHRHQKLASEVSEFDTMSELRTLIATLKRLLKARDLTYRDVAAALDLSETSVKRLFSNECFTVARLESLAGLLGYTLSELVAEVGKRMNRLHALTAEQEGQLVRDDKLMLVAVCACNHWSVDDIVAVYRLNRAECLKRLHVLDRMGLIALLPGDRIRLKVARDFDWLPDGPIRRHFIMHRAQPERLGVGRGFWPQAGQIQHRCSVDWRLRLHADGPRTG